MHKDIIKGAFGVAVLAAASLAQAGYRQTNLVSDGSVPALHTDPNLINPWGLAFSANGPFWIGDQGTSMSTVYGPTGSPFPTPATPLQVGIPPTGGFGPTGVVFNNTQGYRIKENGLGGASAFIFVTLSGTIAGWNPAVDLAKAVTMVDNSANNAVYTGADMVIDKDENSASMLFVANFNSGYIEAYDSLFHKVGQFTDRTKPANYKPFGVHVINDQVVVTFAQQSQTTGLPVAGEGKGFVDVFGPDGDHMVRLISGGKLDAPWGVTLAPKHFGKASGKLLVGNFGNGKIHYYNLDGSFGGVLRGSHHEPIVNAFLWDMKFGNGGLAGDPDTLYFTAGIGNEMHGLFGAISHDGDNDGD